MIIDKKYSSLLLMFCLCFIVCAESRSTQSVILSDEPNKTINLSGVWDVTMGDEKPMAFESKIPVPGVLTMANPKINIDFDAIDLKNDVGYNYVWYRHKFNVKGGNYKKARLFLRAKYNARVFLNGKDVGYDHHSTYSHGEFDISEALNQSGANEILVRVGSWNTASSSSKENSAEWWRNTRAPGIWDDVTIELSNDIFVNHVQVIPAINQQKTICNVAISNESGIETEAILKVSIKDGNSIISSVEKDILLNEKINQIEGVELPSHMLKYWTPGKEGNPKLYTMNVEVKDQQNKLLSSKDVKFGYRNITTEGKDVKLNGEKILFRAENIAFVRAINRWQDVMFDEGWIRTFIRAAIHDYNFNYIRFHLGHAYSKWYEIADEEGLMLQDEWRYMHDDEPVGKDKEEAYIEFWRWIKQNVNHPSIVTWDQENEGNVKLKDLIAEIRAYDPTRLWGEDDFNAHHVYDYSENIIPQPEFEQSATKPSTVLESCRLWTNEFGLLEPREDFKTSRTASGWGIFYFDQKIIGQLLSDIHADIGTFYRAERVQAWAPFALLSGWVNGQNFFLGNIADSLSAQPNLETLKRLNEPIGVSLDMLQAREWYKDKASYLPEGRYTKTALLWNDFDKEREVQLILEIKDLKGNVTNKIIESVQLEAYKTVRKDISVKMPEAKGCYTLNPSLYIDGKLIQGVPRRVMVKNKEDKSFDSFLGFGGIMEPIDGGSSVIENFLGFTPNKKVVETILEEATGAMIDKLSYSEKDELYVLQSTVYQSKTRSTLTTIKINEKGTVISSEQSLALNYVDLPSDIKSIIVDVLGTVPVDESKITKKEDKNGSIYNIKVINSELRYRIHLDKYNKLKKKEVK